MNNARPPEDRGAGRRDSTGKLTGSPDTIRRQPVRFLDAKDHPEDPDLVTLVFAVGSRRCFVYARRRHGFGGPIAGRLGWDITAWGYGALSEALHAHAEAFLDHFECHRAVERVLAG